MFRFQALPSQPTSQQSSRFAPPEEWSRRPWDRSIPPLIARRYASSPAKTGIAGTLISSSIGSSRSSRVCFTHVNQPRQPRSRFQGGQPKTLLPTAMTDKMTNTSGKGREGGEIAGVSVSVPGMDEVGTRRCGGCLTSWYSRSRERSTAGDKRDMVLSQG